MKNVRVARRACLGILIACLPFLSSCNGSEASSKTLRFTAIPDDNTTELLEKFTPVATYLGEQLGIDVEYVPVTSYEASVEAFKNGEVHLAWFGGVTGAQARQAVAGSRAIAQGKVDPEYKSYFIAHKDAGIELSEELPAAMAGKSFTFGARNSTSGRVMPQYFLEQITGKSPEEFFSSVDFSGNHNATAENVAQGAVDVGAISYKTYDRKVAEGKIDPDACRIVWTTPTYADYNWTAHPELDELFGAGTIDQLQGVLIGMKDPALLAACDRQEGLIQASNEDFDALATVASKLGFLDGDGE